MKNAEDDVKYKTWSGYIISAAPVVERHGKPCTILGAFLSVNGPARAGVYQGMVNTGERRQVL